MSQNSGITGVLGASPRITLSGQAQVGVIGDGDNTVYMITPRREVSWPVQLGSPPPLASAFQPRTALLDAMAAVRDGVVLSGDGGTGKSQLAASGFANSDADLRVWVQGESTASIVSGYAEAAVRLDLADPEVGPAYLAGCFLGFLATTDRSWLVVIDDLTEPRIMKELWPDRRGRLLVTTRRRDAALSGGGRTTVDVGVYTPEEAEAYLADRLSPAAADLPDGFLDEAGGLARDLGYLPLGLSHAAAVIIDQGTSCATYRSWFADRSRSLVELFPVDADADGYARTVATTWGLAIDAATQLDSLARPLAHLIAVCDPVGVPEAVFTTEACSAFLAAGLDRQDKVGADQMRRGLRVLHRLSLISHEPKGESPRAVRMHNLTGRAVLRTLPEDDIAALLRVAADAVAEVWPEVERDTALAETLRANTESLSQLAPGALWNGDTGGHVILFRASDSLLQAGLAGQAISYCRDLVDHAVTRLGPEHPHTLSMWGRLARAYEDAGNLGRAVPLFEKTLADCERVLGADHSQTQAARGRLAGAYRAAGDLGRAIPLLEQTLAARQRMLGDDHPNTLTAQKNLAMAYESAGDLSRAVPLLEQTVAARQRILGHDHPQTLTTQSELAQAYQSTGDLGRAVPLLEQTLADLEQVVGPDNPQTLTARGRLAYAYRSTGYFGRAISLYEHTLGDCERILGPDHPHTLAARNNLALGYYAAGDHGRAAPLFEETLAHCQQVFDPDYPLALTTRVNLASAYDAAGNLDRAVSLYEQALGDCQRILGPDHPDTLTAQNNLARGYYSTGDQGRAIPLFEQTLADRERILGRDHPDTLVSRNNLASAYDAAGTPGRAIPLFEQIVADFERVLGPDHPQTLGSRNNLAGVYDSTGDFDRAIPLYERTLVDFERIFGPNHPDTLTVRSNLALGYYSTGDQRRAIPLLEQTLADRQRILGPDHPDTLSSQNNLASALAYRSTKKLCELARSMRSKRARDPALHRWRMVRGWLRITRDNGRNRG